MAVDKTGILNDYYTREELAEELGVTTRTLARWANFRTGPRITRMGHRVLYHNADVRTWLHSQAEGVAA